jgi:uncharacterized protein
MRPSPSSSKTRAASPSPDSSVKTGDFEPASENAGSDNGLSLTPSHFEKLYLAPQNPVAGHLRFTLGNPTPIAAAGFVVCNTAATMMLMGWHGAGGGTGNTDAGTGACFFIGAVLHYLGGIGKWLLGNTFPGVLFLCLGVFWATLAATHVPFFNAMNGYGDDAAAFSNSFATFMVAMTILCFFFTIAAMRANVCLVAILTCFMTALLCLAAAYFYAGSGDVGRANGFPCDSQLAYGAASGFR